MHIVTMAAVQNMASNPQSAITVAPSTIAKIEYDTSMTTTMTMTPTMKPTTPTTLKEEDSSL